MILHKPAFASGTLLAAAGWATGELHFDDVDLEPSVIITAAARQRIAGQVAHGSNR
jgi:hypothetical protein